MNTQEFKTRPILCKDICWSNTSFGEKFKRMLDAIKGKLLANTQTIDIRIQSEVALCQKLFSGWKDYVMI